MKVSKPFAFLAREKWFLLACCVLSVNIYGIGIIRNTRVAADGAPVCGARDHCARPEAASHANNPVPAPGPGRHAAMADILAEAAAPPSPATRTLSVTGIGSQAPSFGDASIRIDLSHRPDAAALRRAITLEPHADFAVAVHQRFPRGYYAELRGGILPGSSYTLTVRGGLTASDGRAVLADDFVRTLAVPDARPGMRVAAQGRYLSPQGSLRLPLQSVNVDRYTLRATRIPAHNLVQYAMREGRHYRGYYGRPEDGIGAFSTNATFELTAERNTISDHCVPLRDLLPPNPRGAYVVDFSVGRHNAGSRTIVVSDTGISVKIAGAELLVWANSIHSLAAVSGATVKAWSSAAELLAEGRTDSDGLVRLPIETPSEARPFMVTVENGDDLSFLDIGAARLPASGQHIAREYPAGAYEAVLYTDRGVYRPGESAHVRGIVRGRLLDLPPRFPVDLEVLRPDGRRHLRLNAQLSDLGTVEFAIEWSDTDATGAYRLLLKTPGGGDTLGSAAIALEEFAPPAIAVRSRTDRPFYMEGEDGRLIVNAAYLYGAPASGSPVSARLTVVPKAFAPAGYPDYSFGNPENEMAETGLILGRGNLDAEGMGVFDFSVAQSWRPPAMLRALLGATVLEQGGRPVSAHAGCDIHPYPFYIGLRAPGLNNLRPNDTVRVDVALVNPDGSALPEVRPLEYSLQSASWNTVMAQDSNGRWRYRSERQLHELFERRLETDAGGRAVFDLSVGRNGTYLLQVKQTDGAASSALEFFVGAEHDRHLAGSMEDPGRLQLELDKRKYRPGETARLTVIAPFAGKALLTVEQDRVLYSAVKQFAANSGVFEIPVEPDCWPNAHVCVTVIREARAADMQQVYRAAGSLPLRLDDADRRLGVEIDAPAEIRPQTTLEAHIRISGPDGRGRPAEFTLAAVDEGICMLTDFQTPDPADMFGALRRNAVGSADLYAMLLAETEDGPVSQRSHTGGDMARLLRGRLNPVRSRRFRPLALWQGAAMTDAAGIARIRLDIPEFSGSVRLMVVAVDESRFGSASHQVLVRRPLTAITALPRFLAPGDSASMFVDLHNNTAEDAGVELSVESDGPLAVTAAGGNATVLPAGRRMAQTFRLHAHEAAGVARVRVRARLGAETYAESIELPVRPAAPRSVFFDTLVAPPLESRRARLPGAWLKGTGEYGLTLSERPTVKLKGALEYLLAYPYGCLEQTVSASLPLLYLEGMPDIFDDGFQIGDLSPMIAAGIRSVLAMQASDGAFGYWPNTREVYEWGSVYAMDFLTEARHAGHDVAADRFDEGLQALGRLLARPVGGANAVGSPDWHADSALRAYICHVLARAGQPRHDWSARLLEQFEHLDGDTRLRLITALTASGRRRDAWNALQSMEAMRISREDIRQTGATLISPARTAALRLRAFSELAPEDGRTLAALRKLEALMENGFWHSTQDNAMAFLALAHYFRNFPAGDHGIRGYIEQDGVKTAFDSRETIDVSDRVGQGELTLFNAGPAPLYAVWRAAGIPLESPPAADNRIAIRRAFFDFEGNRLEDMRARQGELLIVRLTVDTLGEAIDNLVIEELLPAGLEIENANLHTSETVPWIGRENTLPARHVDIRDDRLVVFAGRFSGTRIFHYAARAVTPGRYTLPPAAIEAMYDPFVSSRSGAGEFEVETF